MLDVYPYYDVGLFNKECNANGKYIPSRSQKLKNKKLKDKRSRGKQKKRK